MRAVLGAYVIKQGLHLARAVPRGGVVKDVRHHRALGVHVQGGPQARVARAVLKVLDLERRVLDAVRGQVAERPGDAVLLQRVARLLDDLAYTRKLGVVVDRVLGRGVVERRDVGRGLVLDCVLEDADDVVVG